MFHFNPHYFTLLRCGDIFMNRRIKMLPEEEPSTSSCSSWDQNENFKNARNNNWIKYTVTTWEHYTEKGIQKPMNKETSETKKIMYWDCEACFFLCLWKSQSWKTMQIFTMRVFLIKMWNSYRVFQKQAWKSGRRCARKDWTTARLVIVELLLT